jgi:hypothetical protein
MVLRCTDKMLLELLIRDKLPCCFDGERVGDMGGRVHSKLEMKLNIVAAL